MSFAVGTTREKGSLVRRLMHKRILPALVFAPALALAVFAPSAALAAETAGLEAASMEQGSLTFCEDVYSVESACEEAFAPEEAPSVAEPAIDVDCCESTSDDVSFSYVAEQESQSSPTIENDSSSYNSYQVDSSQNSELAQQETTSILSEEAENQDSNQAAPDVHIASINALNSENQIVDVEESASTTKSDSSAPLSSQSASQLTAHSDTGSGSIVVFDSHPSDITFSAAEGGTIVAGSNSLSSASVSAGQSSVTEHYDDSLSGISTGATAIADDGYHFVKWIDASTGATLSTNASFAPSRPEDGWPATWNIMAIFGANKYIIILNPNGGTAGGGGGSSGEVQLEAIAGSSYQLPLSSSAELSLSNNDSLFSGWNTSATPSIEGAGPSYVIADGQVLDSSIEATLQSLGVLDLDWSFGYTPTVTLYAQWLTGQIAIVYQAGEGGKIIASTNVDSQSDKLASETIDAATGVHTYNASYTGPSGAVAQANSRYHFTGWEVSGSQSKSADANLSAASLSNETVTQLSYFTDSSSAIAAYHALTFTATFAPNSYRFVYGTNGGTGSLSETNLTYGSSAKLAASGLSRNGYKLTGWNTASDGSGTSYVLGQALTASAADALIAAGQLSDSDGSSVTLYAQWEKESTPEGGGSGGGGTSGGGSSSGGETGNNTNSGGSSNSGSNSGQDSPAADNTNAQATDVSQSSDSGKAASQASASEQYYDDDNSYTLGTVGRVASASSVASSIASAIGSTAGATKEAAQVATGALASTASRAAAASQGPVVIADSASGANGGASGEGGAGNFISNMTADEAVEAAGTTVAAVATVGAIAGFVGIGASVAGATAVGAAAVGTASTVGLSSAADLAADIAASASGAAAAGKGAAAIGAAAAGRRKRDDDGEENAE